MTSKVRWLVLAAALFITSDGVLLGCGDKYLVTSRGTRFQRAGLARHPASILVLAPPGTRLATTVDALSLVVALGKVGYKTTVAPSAAEMQRALREGRWDAVLVDAADSTPPRGSTDTAGRVPALVAIAYGLDDVALQRARREHDAVIQQPTRARAVVDAMDRALTERAQRAPSQRVGG